nr:ACT domain-containing protein [Geomicrobium halophilum]
MTALTSPLAEAGISIFAVSTYDTDYLLIKENKLEKSLGVLTNSGHNIFRE